MHGLFTYMSMLGKLLHRRIKKHCQSQLATSWQPERPLFNRPIKKGYVVKHNPLILLVGTEGFEPSTPCTPCNFLGVL